MREKLLKPVVVLAAAAAIFFLLDAIIVSDKERLERTAGEIEKAVESGDVEKCLSFVSPDYFFDGLDVETLQKMAKEIFDVTGKMKIKNLDRTITVSGDLGILESKILARSTQESLMPFSVTSEWRVSFRKDDGHWLVWKIEPLSLGEQPVHGLMDLRHRL